MLGWRLTMSAILIPAFIAAFWLDHRFGWLAPILFVLCQLLALRCVWELTLLLRPRYLEVQFWPPALGCAAVLTAAWLPHWRGAGNADLMALVFICAAFVAFVLCAFAYEAWRYHEPGRRIESLALHLLGVAYIGVLLAATAQLRWVAGAPLGYYVLGSMVIAVKMGDTGAYTTGRLFGRRKMAPLLSPGKTWAGFFGAIGGAALGAWLWLHFAAPLYNATPPALWWALMYGAVLGVVGLIGDLCESLIKRDMQQKDAAALMPGFGGLLDLLDSIFFAGPVAWALWKLV